MPSSTHTSSISTPTESSLLAAEIASLQSRITLQKTRLAQHTSTLLSHTSSTNPLLTSALNTQKSHNASNILRLTSPTTCFRVKNPDPCAATPYLIALRFERFMASRRKFARPYYVFLQQVEDAAEEVGGRVRVRVYRHTFPPSINISALAKRYLPLPSPLASDDNYDTSNIVKKERRQDLRGFVMGVRRAVAGMEWRTGVVEGLNGVRSVDAEGRHLRVEGKGWIGRAVLGEGVVDRMVVYGEEGRDWKIERKVLRGGGVKGFARRLDEVV